MALEQAPTTANEAAQAGLQVSFEAGYISKQEIAQKLAVWLKPAEREAKHGN